MDTDNSTIQPLIQSYAVDFASTNNFLFVKGIQGDGHSTRYVDITLLNESQPYEINPDAVEVVIRGTKPDTKVIFNKCSIVDSNTIRAEITQQMSAVPGQGHYEISIMDKEENKTLTSFPFFIVISKSSFDIGYVVSSDEFGLLIEKINQVNTLKLNVAEIIEESLSVIRESRKQTDECKTATEESIDATNKLKDFHNSAEEAENTRKENEKKRQADTATAISNTESATQDATNQTNVMKQLESDIEDSENKRSDAEKLRVQQSIDFENEENKRKANEIVRKNNEEQRALKEQERVLNETTRQQQEEKREINTQKIIEQTQSAISETNEATNNANIASSYAKSVGDDLVERLNRGEFKGEKGDDGVITTVSGQYAFQIENDDLYMYYSEGDKPLDVEIDENGDFILNLTEGGI